MVYINIKENNKVETIDQFENRREARQTLKEYKIASPYYANAYLSQRCSKNWNN